MMEAITALIEAHEQGIDTITLKTVTLCPQCGSKVSGRQIRWKFCRCGYNDEPEKRSTLPKWQRGHEITIKVVGSCIHASR